jgi:hypothetical protein
MGLDRGLFSGLAFTSAASGHPVVSRLAALHLGTTCSFGIPVSHIEARPTVFEPEDLQQDLKNSVAHLHAAGCKGFATKLNSATAHTNWDGARSEQLSQEILGMLDNTPAWERSQPQAGERRARGAIDCFTRGQKRLRP